jgi:hypothetical protein
MLPGMLSILQNTFHSVLPILPFLNIPENIMTNPGVPIVSFPDFYRAIPLTALAGTETDLCLDGDVQMSSRQFLMKI